MINRIIGRLKEYIRNWHRQGDYIQESMEKYNGGWIPCRERLPEDNNDVLISTNDGLVIFGAYIQGHSTWWSGDYSPEVLAWQPLPESYKEDN